MPSFSPISPIGCMLASLAISISDFGFPTLQSPYERYDAFKFEFEQFPLSIKLCFAVGRGQPEATVSIFTASVSNIPGLPR